MKYRIDAFRKPGIFTLYFYPWHGRYPPKHIFRIKNRADMKRPHTDKMHRHLKVNPALLDEAKTKWRIAHAGDNRFAGYAHGEMHGQICPDCLAMVFTDNKMLYGMIWFGEHCEPFELKLIQGKKDYRGTTSIEVLDNE